MRYAVLILLLLIAAPVLRAQNGHRADSVLAEVERLYNSARYVEAELEARRLREETTLTDSASVLTDRWIAFALIAQGRTTAARERFISALTTDPDLELDPVLTSPKILAVYNDAREQFLLARKQSGMTVSGPVAVPSPPVSFRMALFPGWEQLHRGRTVKGAAFLGAGAVSLASGVTFGLLRASARQRYLDAATPSDISSRYDTYNAYRTAEIYSYITFAAVYCLSNVDVFTDDDPPAITLHPAAGDGRGHQLTLAIRF